MTTLETLDGHIARQAQICADAALRLEALQLARRALLDRSPAELTAIGLQVDDDRVSVFYRVDDADWPARPAERSPAPAPAPVSAPAPAPTSAPPASTALTAQPAATPVPRAVPAIVAAPAPDPEPAPKIDNRAALAKEWPAEAVAELQRRYAAGEATTDIAKAMDRTTKQVTNKAFRLGLRRGAKPCDQALPMQPVTKRPARHATPKTTGKSKPQETIAQRLDVLGNSRLWTPQKDLDLALAVVRGDRTAIIATAMKLEPDDVTARWLALCPNRNDKPGINALLRELKVRAHA